MGAHHEAQKHFLAACSIDSFSKGAGSTVRHMAALSLAILYMDTDTPDSLASATELLKQHDLFSAINTSLPHHERCLRLSIKHARMPDQGVGLVLPCMPAEQPDLHLLLHVYPAYPICHSMQGSCPGQLMETSVVRQCMQGKCTAGVWSCADASRGSSWWEAAFAQGPQARAHGHAELSASYSGQYALLLVSSAMSMHYLPFAAASWRYWAWSAA